MVETVITIAIVLAAMVWFIRWFRGTAKGEKGCSCCSCDKGDCASRGEEKSVQQEQQG